MEVMPTLQNLPINYMNILTALKTMTFRGFFTTGRWQTVGVHHRGRNDTFEIDFDTCDASLEVNFDNNNVTEAGVLPSSPSDTDILSANFDDLFGPELKKAFRT